MFVTSIKHILFRRLDLPNASKSLAAVRPLDVDSYCLSFLKVCAHASRPSHSESEGTEGW